MKYLKNTRNYSKRRRNICFTTGVIWFVGSLSETLYTQVADAFTTSSSCTVSLAHQCDNGKVGGKRISSLGQHKTSSSSSVLPLPTSIFDFNEMPIQLIPLEDTIQCNDRNYPELTDVLAGLSMPLRHDTFQENRDYKFSDDNREFELKLGKAMDTLRKDYPEMLKTSPDFSIYDENIEVVDPSGFKLHNLDRYKASFRFLHGMLNFFYDPKLSLLTFKLVFDCARKDIRVSWNAYLVPRPIYGGEGNALYLDGISVYVLNKVSGMITHHRVENLLLNDVPVKAPQGIFEAMRSAIGAEEAEGVPVWNIDMDMDGKGRPTPGQFTLEFRRHVGLLTGVPSKSSLFSEEEGKGGSEEGSTHPTSTSLFSSESSSDGVDKSSSSVNSENSYLNSPLFDEIAFEKKNASRKKFGLKPITPDEFIQIQAKVEELASVQREKASSAHASAEMTKPKEKTKLFGSLFGGILDDTCESNWDCKRPEVCCDLIVKKMCCSSGMKVFDGAPQMQRMPVRIPIDDGPQLPRGGPDTDIY